MRLWSRLFVLAAVGTLAAGSLGWAQTPVSGEDVPVLAALDSWATFFLSRYQIPGGAIAVARNGSLLYARGFGYQDEARRTPVQPNTLFRVASISKPITAAAILKLVEQGVLRLEDRAFDIITDLGTPTDARIRNITIAQLLHHTGGWDIASMGFDPMFRSVQSAQIVGVPAPGDCSTIIRRMLRNPLVFNPGARYSYSNFGYCILGRVIERVTRSSYEEHMRQEVLAPMGISAMRVGKTLAANRLPGETFYFMPPGAGQAISVFPPHTENVSWPYGGWYLEAMDSHGGWVASAPDLVRFASQLSGQRGAGFLSAASQARLATRPPAPLPQTASSYYGFGWGVDVGSGGNVLSHSGSLDGTTTYLVQLSNGISWAAVFNMRPFTSANYFREIFDGINRIVTLPAERYPVKDEFPKFLANATVQIADLQGVVNGASFAVPFAPGSWVTIRGKNLAPNTRVWRGEEIVNGALPTTLDGVSVRINNKPASVYFVSPEQINVQAPEGIASGPVKVEVIREGVGRDVRMGDLRSNAPALFSYGAQGQTWAAAVHLDGAVVGAETVPGTRVLRAGERALLFGSGFGPASAGRVLREPIPLASLPHVTIGGIPVTVEFAGYVSSGLVQINILIPSTFSLSGDLELSVAWGTPEVATQPGVKLPVREAR